MSDPKPLTAFQQTYHWRNKNCGPWAHEWVKKTLPGVKVEQGAEKAEIVEVTTVTGDCDLGQRKGKLLTIYDFEVVLQWIGTTSEGEEAKGSIKITEFSHEVLDGLSEYCYETTLSSTSTKDAQSLLATLRKAFPAALTPKLNTFRPELLATHGNPSDGASSPASASGTSTPAAYAPAPPTKAADAAKPAAAAAAPKAAAGGYSGSTSTVEVTAQLQASAEDIWGLLTDEKRIPMWSRSNAKMALKPEGEYELFGGNVRGKVQAVEQPTKLVQTWQTRNGKWPTDHYATLTTSLAQGSDSTTVTFSLDGVPTGQEDDLKRAIDQFYIQGLKQMGLVHSSTSRTLSSRPAQTYTPSSASRQPRHKPRDKSKSASKSSQESTLLGGLLSPQVLGVGALLGLSAVFVGLVVYSIPGAAAGAAGAGGGGSRGI
ncbi:activator of Hsp90 ATPase [Dioszegia hungarica]|uniref:Activator of Hsp90 ATPase n=1 Tax=Dioszegia hungarica TaxID=4972 RepID=A0AA38LY65_9TREE|nr:activator of Hsp90 ATPase [Dioszegia hungarica]KAI9639523.1 activator of Hsp90 ATPase [Dioszegia hungarica]